MFGYVLVNKPELKIKDFEKYRSYYCGLCHALGERHGTKGRLTLNYDMTFLIMILTDLYETEERVTYGRCPVHPAKKHCSRRSSVTDYCADMCVLLAYYKCKDDWDDEKKVKARVSMNSLKKSAEKVGRKYPEKAASIAKKMNMLSIVESAENLPMDKVAKVFGEIMAEVFCYRDDMWKEDLYRVGFYLGKFIYLLDAYEDIELDIKTGDYNPFKELYRTSSPEEFNDRVLNLLLLMIGECTDAFERLPLVENVEILRNILYSGVWVRYGKAKSERLGGKGETEHNEGEDDIVNGSV